MIHVHSLLGVVGAGEDVVLAGQVPFNCLVIGLLSFIIVAIIGISVLGRIIFLFCVIIYHAFRVFSRAIPTMFCPLYSILSQGLLPTLIPPLNCPAFCRILIIGFVVKVHRLFLPRQSFIAISYSGVILCLVILDDTFFYMKFPGYYSCYWD